MGSGFEAEAEQKQEDVNLTLGSCAIRFPIPYSPLPVVQTLRVATAGGTRDARRAGPSTASWPSTHRQMNPIGT